MKPSHKSGLEPKEPGQISNSILETRREKKGEERRRRGSGLDGQPT